MFILPKLTRTELLENQIKVNARFQAMVAQDTASMDPMDRVFHKMALDRTKEQKDTYDGAVRAREELAAQVAKAEERLALAESRGVDSIILSCWSYEIYKMKERLA